MSEGLKMFVREDSVAQVQESARSFGRRVIGAIIIGMREGMGMLAGAIAGRIHSRSGQTAAAVLHGVNVTETPLVVRGRVGTGFVGSEPRGTWLEFGTNVPEVRGPLMAFQGSGGPVFTRHHKAFRVPAHPVFNPTLQSLKGEIIARIQSRMDAVAPQ